MKYEWIISEKKLDISYQWKQNNKWNSISIASENKLKDTETNSEEHFIAEHYWGYIRVNGNKSYEFRVEHPPWKIYLMQNFNIDIDFEMVYGKDFCMLKHQTPSSSFLVEGSEVLLGDKKRIA